VSPIVAVTDVRKLYGRVRALDAIDLEIGAGVTGLLGPNGSGKSTLFKLIAGQLHPDTGEIRVFGRDPRKDPAVFRALGLCPEQDKFYEEMSGEAFVAALTRLHGFSAADAAQRARAALARVGMAELAHKPIRAMSRGMRQRTKIAQAIAHDPALVLLDEPLNGTDPIARADLIALVRALGDEGRAVIVSSHVLHEVESMTREVILIRHGRLRAQGDITRLRALLADRPYRIRITVRAADGAPEPARRFAAALLGEARVRAAELIDADTLEITALDLDGAAQAIPALAERMGLVIHGFTSPDADLESLYRYLIQR